MCDNEQLVAYVYDEMNRDERSRLEDHLGGCADCRAELAGLRAARVQLAAWTPPELDVDFQIVRHNHGGWRAWWSPAWGLAAAAALVLAAAAAIANVQVRYDRDGMTIRTGWSHTATPPASTAAAVPAAPAADPVLTARYAAMDRRLRLLETAAAHPASAPVAASTAKSDAEVMRRVRDLLAQSESRQQSEMAVRVAQVMTDVNRQRQADLVRISNSFEQLQGIAAADRVQHRQVINAMARLAQQR
jgi:putative zinc finger protein